MNGVVGGGGGLGILKMVTVGHGGGGGGSAIVLWSRSLWTAPNMSKTFLAWGGQKIYKNHWGLWVFFKPLQYSHFGKAFQFAG